MTSLSLEKLLLLLPYDKPPEKLVEVNLSNKSIISLPKQGLGFLKTIRKLDLSHNAGFSDLTPISKLQTLTQLNISSIRNLTGDSRRTNFFLDLTPLKSLTNLVVLNISNSNVRSLSGLEGCAKSLKALIANDNDICLYAPPSSASLIIELAEVNKNTLGTLTALETIVLSRNPNLSGGYYCPSEEEEEEKNESVKKNEGEKDNIDLEEKEKNKKKDKNENDSNNNIMDNKKIDKLSKKNKKNVKNDNENNNNFFDNNADKSQQNRKHIAEDPNNPLNIFTNLENLRKLSLSGCGIRCLPRRWYVPLLTELRLSNNQIKTVSKGVIFRTLKILDISNNLVTDWRCLHRAKFLRVLSLHGNPLISLSNINEGKKTDIEGEEGKKRNKSEDEDNSCKNNENEEINKKYPFEFISTSSTDKVTDSSHLELLFLRSCFLHLETIDGKKIVADGEPVAGSLALAETIQAKIREYYKLRNKMNFDDVNKNSPQKKTGITTDSSSIKDIFGIKENIKREIKDESQEEDIFEENNAKDNINNDKNINSPVKSVRIGDGLEDEGQFDETIASRHIRKQYEKNLDSFNHNIVNINLVDRERDATETNDMVKRKRNKDEEQHKIRNLFKKSKVEESITVDSPSKKKNVKNKINNTTKEIDEEEEDRVYIDDSLIESRNRHIIKRERKVNEEKKIIKNNNEKNSNYSDKKNKNKLPMPFSEKSSRHEVVFTGASAIAAMRKEISGW